jgi:hypothetical protein
MGPPRLSVDGPLLRLPGLCSHDARGGWGQELTLVKVGELLERSGTVVPPRGHRLAVEAPGSGHMRRPHCPQSGLTMTLTSTFSIWL